MRHRIAVIAACAASAVPVLVPHSIYAQARALTRSDAVRTALERGPRLGVARAENAVANAQLVAARAIPNPSVTATYSKDTPQHHLLLNLPIDLPNLRGLRVRSAELGVHAADLRFRFAQASIMLDADTTYTRAIAARDRLVLSVRNAAEADSLLRMVESRREAGDAAEIDVELARVSAGELENVAAADSLTAVSALLDLQAVLGVTSENLEIAAIDSLVVPPAATTPGQTLSEAAASVSLESATLAARLQHRSIWSTPSITFGFDEHDPSQRGILPTYGVGIGLPFFDRNSGAIAEAEAERSRATAELALAQVEARNQVAHALRERANAMAKVARDARLVTSANAVAAMSLTAYREGASSLPNVLEARRNARDLLGQYIDDLAAAWIATAELRALSLTSSTTLP
jgi:cobalt-zinc-cadmium efflux system outer membrane protein